jgi:hypothetical protein
VERAKETHLPSASGFNDGFAPDEDMIIVKTRGIDGLGCKQVISHAVPYIARLLSLLLCLPFISLLVRNQRREEAEIKS